MPDSIDDLARRWKAQPDAAGAVTLCETLRRSGPTGRAALVDEVGKLAVETHPADAQVLLAVARLYAAVERLSDAQGVLIAAGKVAPRDSNVYRLLGEVLLRRGDAERAEKVLLRAKQLGADDADTAMWIDRAKVFRPVQAKAGARAVAIEVKNTAIHPVTPPPHIVPPARARVESIDQITSVRSSPIQQWSGGNEEATRAGFSIPTDANLQRGVLDFPRDIPLDAPLDVPLNVPLNRASPAAPLTGPMKLSQHSQGEIATVARPAPFADLIHDVGVSAASAPLAPSVPVEAITSAPRMAGIVLPDPTENTETNRYPRAGAERPIAATLASPVASAAASASPSLATGALGPIPTAREVLDALANAGVFEPREAGAGPIQWDRPKEKVRRRTAVGLSVGIVLFLAGSAGVLGEIHRRRAIAHDEAETILAKVEADLEASKSSLLPGIEQAIGHAFELDSRSPRAALDWLQERALKGLLQGGAELAFEDAESRATEVKVPDEKFAFARVSAFLFQGDTGGAAGLLSKWDGPAANDALYQLVTGATLERAGDIHATARYLAATKLAPKLVMAELLLTRATAIDGDPSKAADLAKQFRAKYPDRAEGAALVALAWARDPARGEQAPAEVAETIARAGELPLPLLPVPHALQAIAAIDKHAYADAKPEIEKGLAVAADSGMATWLGSIALETRDEPLVRKAALLAVTFSAVYPPARVLAARIALLGGRLDEALKATEDLDPTSPDVAVVRAAAAYERADADAMGRALEATSPDARKLPTFTALNLAPDVLLGREASLWPRPDASAKVLEMSSDEAPWSDLVAMDTALDLGLTDVADKILGDWKGTEDKPLRALRLSRLSRYENHLDQADHYSKVALDGATVTPRTLMERALVLVARNHAGEVGPLLAKYPLVLGPASSWLSAYALASTGKLDEARGRTAQLDAPPALSPLPFRMMAALSLATMKDKKRAEPAVRALLSAGIADPDLLAAAASIGLKTPGAPPPAPPPRGKGKK